MSWRKISMKFPGTCIVCNKKIEANEIGLWAQGLGVKHEKCAEIKELKCIVCGASAGCSQCEYNEDCSSKTANIRESVEPVGSGGIFFLQGNRDEALTMVQMKISFTNMHMAFEIALA